MTRLPIVLGFSIAALLVSYGARDTRAGAAAEPVLTPTTTVSDNEATDLYGNEIESAVGDYRIDIQGEVYEYHAPEIAIELLPPPSV